MKKIFTFLIISVLTQSAFAQQSIFIQPDNIKGESTDSKHREWIEATAFSGGSSNSGSLHTGSGGGAGKVNVQDYTFAVCLDKSSNILRAYGHNGRHLAFVNVDFVRPLGGQAGSFIYSQIRMEDVLVTSFSEGATTSDGKTLVNISFNFARYRTSYIPIDSKGAPGTPVIFGWDIAQNIAW
jgi:type VI secretion system secreted protein Hcp